MKLEEFLANPNNSNPLFQRIFQLSISCFEKPLKKKAFEKRAIITATFGGGILDGLLSREPNPKYQKSKSVFKKYMLGSYGGNIEAWSSPSGQKFIIITNGERGKKRRARYVIPVKKIGEYWVEWNETIQP